MKKISKTELKLTTFVQRVFREELGLDKCLPAADRQWSSAISLHVGISENIELVEELICSHESALHVYKNRYKTEKEMDISLSSVQRIAKHDFRLKTYKCF